MFLNLSSSVFSLIGHNIVDVLLRGTNSVYVFNVLLNTFGLPNRPVFIVDLWTVVAMIESGCSTAIYGYISIDVKEMTVNYMIHKHA